MAYGGVVLCGGQSRRMGRPKLSLPFGPETMLARVVRLLADVVEPMVVVAAADQSLPDLPAEVLVARDRRKDCGPLEGLAVGLQALADRAEAAFVTACDVPLLKPAFVRRMIELSADHDVTVPHIEGFDEPLAAVYRTDLVPKIEALLGADRRRPLNLFNEVRTRRVTADELLDVDPQWDSLHNVNSPEDYRAALAKAGLSAVE